MFAVLKTGGKQYKVATGDVLRIEKLDALAGDKIQFNEILMIGNTVGAPFVADAGVQAEVIDQIKGEKTINFVKRRRKHSSARKKGHRQQLTLVRIGDKSGVKAAVNGAGFKIEPAYVGAPTSKKAAAAVERASKPKAEKKAVAPKAAAAKAEPKAKAAPKAKVKTDGDDLTQISGVGPVIVKNITSMDEKLNFKGRIDRDNWLEQAAELAK